MMVFLTRSIFGTIKIALHNSLRMLTESKTVLVFSEFCFASLPVIHIPNFDPFSLILVLIFSETVHFRLILFFKVQNMYMVIKIKINNENFAFLSNIYLIFLYSLCFSE